MFTHPSTARLKHLVYIGSMHPTTERLYKALAAHLGSMPGSTAAASALGFKSAQRMNNWDSRGVSQEGIVQAALQCKISPPWIVEGELPMFIGGGGAEKANGKPTELVDISLHNAVEVFAISMQPLDTRTRGIVVDHLRLFVDDPADVERVKGLIDVSIRTANRKAA